MPRVSLVKGVCTVRKSARVKTSSNEAHSTSRSRACSGAMKGSCATIFIPNARARTATAHPMRPRPMIPRVLRCNSAPMKRFRSHFAAFTLLFACGTLRARATSKAIVCSAVVIVLPSGAFMTTMPRVVAAGTSMLSTPTPARPITRSLSAASIKFAVTFVSLRTIRPSTSTNALPNSSGERPVFFSTEKPASRNGCKPLSLTSSATRIFVSREVIFGKLNNCALGPHKPNGDDN